MKQRVKPKAIKGTKRVDPSPAVCQDVITRCRRRCCVCYGLNRDLRLKRGQLAHLNRDPSKSDADDLAYLCLTCHNHYDLKGNRTLGYTPEEVRVYRNQLYTIFESDLVEWQLTVRAPRTEYAAARSAVESAKTLLFRYTRNISVNEGPVAQ